MGPEGSSAMPCAACSGREVCWVLCVPAWDWTGMRSLGPCPAVRAHVPNPAGWTSDDPCKLQTVKLLQVGALALCPPWQQGEKGLKQCSGSKVLCRRLLAVPWG